MNLRKDHYRLAFLAVHCEPSFARSVGFGRAGGQPGRGRRAVRVEVKVGANLVSPRPRTSTIFFLNPLHLIFGVVTRVILTTSNGGPLGSCIDEERSKLRYLV